MRLFGELVSDVGRGLVELVLPGKSNPSGRSLSRALRVALTILIVATNLAGVCAVLVVALFVVPLPSPADPGHVRLVNAIASFAYTAVAVPVGVVLGTRGLRRVRRWLAEERPATPQEQRLVLRAPLRVFVLKVALWLGAAVVFGALNASYSGSLGVRVAIIVVITGLVTASCAYLLSERTIRAAASRALAGGMFERVVPTPTAVGSTSSSATGCWPCSALRGANPITPIRRSPRRSR